MAAEREGGVFGIVHARFLPASEKVRPFTDSQAITVFKAARIKEKKKPHRRASARRLTSIAQLYFAERDNPLPTREIIEHWQRAISHALALELALPPLVGKSNELIPLLKNFRERGTHIVEGLTEQRARRGQRERVSAAPTRRLAGALAHEYQFLFMRTPSKNEAGPFACFCSSFLDQVQQNLTAKTWLPQVRTILGVAF
ncbi:MAG TPA: hypothetical protein VFC38_11525 [Stellaceae bacterium]|nr:hypothetical protein [Stellaceae bacterium]